MSARKCVSALVILLLSLTVLAASSVPAASGPADDRSRSSPDRATTIDGEHRDEFDAPYNVSLYGDAATEGGQLRLSRVVWGDEFDRVLLSPWTAAEGSPRIFQKVLRTNATETANATAERDLDMHDLQIEIDMGPGIMAGGGPMIYLEGSSVDRLWFSFSSTSETMMIGYDEGGLPVTLQSNGFTMVTDQWFTANLMIDGQEISMRAGGSTVTATLDTTGNFTTVGLYSRFGESCAWDNVTLKKLEASGFAISLPVNLPEDTYWDALRMARNAPPGTTMTVQLLNGSDNEPLPGFEDLTKSSYLLSERGEQYYIDPLNTIRVKLRVDMSLVGVQSPSLNFWEVSWLGDAPERIGKIPDYEMDEDSPVYGVINMSKYFRDGLTPSTELTYSVAHVSDSQYVTPVIDGHMLGFELPMRHWSGEVTYSIEASDGVLSVEGFVSKVTVNPVDDTPIIRPLPELTVTEDEEYVFNISSYVDDVDTPRHRIVVREYSFNATVQGFKVTLFYKTGGFNETIEINVADDTTSATAYLEVQVVEVDDPPVVGTLYPRTIDEDVEEFIDLSDKVSDEDTDIAKLTIEVREDDDNITLEYPAITLLFATGGVNVTYHIDVSDGNTTATMVLEVTVIEANDKPVVVSVGDQAPEGGKVNLTMIEGETLPLDLIAEDEETEVLEFSLLQPSWEGASIEGQTLTLTATVGEMGSYKAQLMVSDGEVSTIVIVNVLVGNRNDPPEEVRITEPANLSVFQEGDPVTLKAFAVDPDVPYGDELFYFWNSSINGSLGEGREITVSDLGVGGHVITVEVTDGEVSVEATIMLTINATSSGGNGGGDGDGGDDGDDSPGPGALATAAGLATVASLLAARRRRRDR